MKVLRPSKNKQTQGYSERHPAYDHDDIPDKNYCSSLYGVVVQSKNSETRTWKAFTDTDPYKNSSLRGEKRNKLITADYGNYIKIKGEVDGKVVYQLGAHFQPGTVLPKGTEVKRGQVVAQAGKTGNCQPIGAGDGSHSHTEYRDGADKNFPVDFTENGEEAKEDKDMQSQEQIIKDAYFAIPGYYPSDDAIKARQQKNENTAELIIDLLKGDAKSKPRWLEIWGVKEVKDQVAENFGETLEKVNELLRPVNIRIGDKTEIVLAKIQELVDFKLRTEEEAVPKLVIKIGEEDFKHFWRWGDFVIGVIGEKTSEKLKGGGS